MAFVFTCPAFATAQTDGDNKKDKDIVIRTERRENGKFHHAPARIPMEVSYMSFASALKITYLYDLGDIEVNVTNHSTGEYLEGTMNATAGVTMLPISGAEGFYTITFTLPGGTE